MKRLLLLFVALYPVAICFSQLQFVTVGKLFTDPGSSGIMTVTSNGQTNFLHRFPILDPTTPIQNTLLTEGYDGKLYGMTTKGGAYEMGTVYRVNPDGSDFETFFSLSPTLHSYPQTPVYTSDGSVYLSLNDTLRKITSPTTSTAIAGLPAITKQLQVGPDGWLYGISGNSSTPIIFKIQPDGSNLTTLHTFDPSTEGFFSRTYFLTLLPNGSIYGCSESYSNENWVFKLSNDGTGFTILKHLGPSEPDASVLGFRCISRSAMTEKNGKLYFNTVSGGANEMGSFLSLDTLSQTVSVEFSNTTSIGFFRSNLVPSGSKWAGLNEQGLFEINADGSGIVQHSTSKTKSGWSELLKSSTGDLYHVEIGGSFNDFYLSQFIPGYSSDLNIHSYGNVPAGYNPLGGLLKGPDGNLYGILSSGGPTGGGFVYRMNPNGLNFERIHSFDDGLGQRPVGMLLATSNNKIFGICQNSGPLGLSENNLVYSMDLDGNNYQVHIVLDRLTYGDIIPSLTEASGGYIYGLTNSNDAPPPVQKSTIFRIMSNGSNFSMIRTIDAVQGNAPRNRLLYADSNFYAIAAGGGAFGGGAILQISEKDFTITTVKNFDVTSTGAYALNGFIMGSDKRIYGSLLLGGPSSGGTIFQTDTTGADYGIIHAFGDAPEYFYMLTMGLPTEASDGRYYGMVQGGLYSWDGGGTNLSSLPVSIFGESASVSLLNYLTLTEVPYTTLPIRLLNFTATKQQQGSLLEWVTGSEEKFSRFEIQRSDDGLLFHTIDRLPGHGNTNSKASYTYTDQHPINGKNFYRLKCIDSDEKFVYSPTRIVNFSAPLQLVAYPNPATNTLSIRHSLKGSYMMLKVLNSVGTIVQVSTVQNQSVIQLPVNLLPNGLYYLELSNGTEVQQGSFIKK